jgi:hypothetical protein
MKTALRFVVVLIFASALALAGQQPPKGTQEPAPKEEAQKAPDNRPTETAYRVTYTIYELEGGQRVNQRDYSSIAMTNSGPSEIRIGTRVPESLEEKKVSYLDVGLHLRCFLTDKTPGKLRADFDITITSFALPEQGASPATGGLPVLRNTNANTRGFLIPGKPMVISSIDDLNSKKRTQIEVMATRLE